MNSTIDSVTLATLLSSPILAFIALMVLLLCYCYPVLDCLKEDDDYHRTRVNRPKAPKQARENIELPVLKPSNKP
ncbi:unnamed protein product [Clavelina lepadiformis]|uniref:Uncharacterized protein n=1 Tax=Clavelina lepadiformis TaxID=159417 RepID=A0ABP0GAF7_CLALP